MRFTPITIFGRKYRIVPSLENMCNLEAEMDTNLIAGVNPLRVNLRFLRSTISNLIEDEQGNHLDEATNVYRCSTNEGTFTIGGSSTPTTIHDQSFLRRNERY